MNEPIIRRPGEGRSIDLGNFRMSVKATAARPDVTVDLTDGSRPVHVRAAEGDERSRLWAQWAVYDKGLDELAARRSRQTQVVILEPRDT